jgi:hypothetical protein
MHVQVYAYMCACLHVCECSVYMNACMHMNVSNCACVGVYVSMCVNVCIACVHVCIYVCQ